MAVRAGGRSFGTGDGIDDVAVDGLGPAEGDRRGVVVIEGLTCMTRLKF
jgi:hypothetical protein